MINLLVVTLLFSLAPALSAERQSPKHGFFSIEAPGGWNPVIGGDILLFSSPDAHAQITASLLAEQGSFADARRTLEDRGFKITNVDERKIFHGFRCLYAYGDNPSPAQKGLMYYCLARRGTQRWSVAVFYFVDSNYERYYSSTREAFLDSFRWDDGVNDDH